MPSTPEAPARAWDARSYHRISGPQLSWGLKVLETVALDGGETVLDAGCGTGRLSAVLLDRLPRGRLIANDQSAQMLEVAREHLLPAYGERVSFLHADLLELGLEEACELVFSTATFHWIPDHPRLFERLHRALRPGGRLVAQCGGQGNLSAARADLAALMAAPRFASSFTAWSEPWHYPTAEETAERLRAAGFEEVRTWLEPAPTPLGTEAAFREFMTQVVARTHLAALPDEAERSALLDEVVARAARWPDPFVLDYVRLNLRARRPGG